MSLYNLQKYKLIVVFEAQYKIKTEEITDN